MEICAHAIERAVNSDWLMTQNYLQWFTKKYNLYISLKLSFN